MNYQKKSNIEVAQGAECTPLNIQPFTVNSICQVHQSLSLKYFRKRDSRDTLFGILGGTEGVFRVRKFQIKYTHISLSYVYACIHTYTYDIVYWYEKTLSS